MHESIVGLSEQARPRRHASATSVGIGFGTPSGAPSGMTFAVTKPATAAPWENPPSTMLVLGQFAAADSICALASRMPAMAVGKSVRGGVVDRIYRRSTSGRCGSAASPRTRLLSGRDRASSVVPRANTTSTSGHGCADAGRNACAQRRPTRRRRGATLTYGDTALPAPPNADTPRGPWRFEWPIKNERRVNAFLDHLLLG